MAAKLIAVCGLLCSGKSTYAAGLRERERAVALSVDEVMLALFDPQLGDSHEAVAARTRRFLLDKAAEITITGIPVVLDWGFWRRADRAALRAFCAERGIPCELHYLHISPETWRARIEKRNRAVQAGECAAYYVDENLRKKFENAFEPPERGEIDRWVEANA